MKVKTINIRGEGVDDISNILQKNLENGWVFLGFGTLHTASMFVGDNSYIEFPVMSFRHDDWTEETVFFEA